MRSCPLLVGLLLASGLASQAAKGATPPAASRPHLGALTSASANAPRALHPGPPVLLQLTVSADRLELVLTGEQRAVGPWLGIEREYPVSQPLAPELRAELTAAAAAAFAGELPAVEIDGVRVEPVVEDVRAYDATARYFGDEHAFALHLAFPCEGVPEAVAVTWGWFPADTRGGHPKVPFQATAEGGFDYFVLTEEDPSFIWRPHAAGPIELAPVLVPATDRTARLVLPLVVAAVLTAAALAMGRRRLAWTVGLTGGALGPLLFVLAGLRPDVPEGDPARDLFVSLHERMYAAFDATTESQVYDLLAASVDASILEGLYEGIRDSLVDREDGGGAISRVDRVDVLDVAWLGEPADDGRPAFDVRADWRVDGRVIHFAHEHRRRTRYQAVVRVAHDGDAWRIAGMTVEGTEREDLGDDEPGVGAAPEDPPGSDGD